MALVALSFIPLSAILTSTIGRNLTAPILDELIRVRLSQSLPDRGSFTNVNVQMQLSKRSDQGGKNYFDGGIAMTFLIDQQSTAYAFALRKVTSFTDDGTTVEIVGQGSLLEAETKKSKQVRFDLKIRDQDGSTTSDGWSMHIWQANSDLDLSATWDKTGFSSIEISRTQPKKFPTGL